MMRNVQKVQSGHTFTRGAQKSAGGSRRLRACLLAIAALASAALCTSPVDVVHAQVSQAADNPDESAGQSIPDDAAKPRSGARVLMPLKDDESKRIVGRAVWFTLEKLGYVDSKEQPQEITWAELEPKKLGQFLSQLPDRGDAQGLLITAEVMIDHGVEDALIERMFDYALHSDRQAADRIEALRKKLADRIATHGGETPDAGGEEGPRPEAGNAENPAQATNPHAWPVLTPEEDAKYVEELIVSTDKVLASMGHPMEHTQTSRFLVYSDLNAKESRYWVSLLDSMYDRMCEIFDVDKKFNIWKGKALVLFFSEKSDFQAYEKAAYGSNLEGAAGVCYTSRDGLVNIFMYRQADEKDLAHVLVHEATHGFLARYQSRIHVPNWLNEGLADYVADKLVDAKWYPRRANDSRKYVQSRGRLDDFLTANNINFEHYGVAYDITDMMIQENRKGYVQVIQGIKQGMSVEDAFKEKYGASLERVFEYYARTRLKMDKLELN